MQFWRLKKREISSIFRFYSWDFARLTNRCCLSFARQALLRFYRLNRLFILIASAREPEIAKTQKETSPFLLSFTLFPSFCSHSPLCSFLLSHSFPPSPVAPFRAGFVTVLACLSCFFGGFSVGHSGRDRLYLLPSTVGPAE